MAESDSTGNGTNSKNSTLKSDKLSHDDLQQDMSGWLMKRSKISHKWKKTWFLLKNSELVYGNSAELTKKKIPLESAEIAETTIDQKNYAFRIKPKDSKRTYYLYAEDETSQNDWMQAICFAKAAGKHGDKSEACVIQ